MIKRGLLGINFIILSVIILMSFVGIGQIWYTIDNYQQLVYDNYAKSIKQLLNSKSSAITRSLYARQKDFANNFKSNPAFIHALTINDIDTVIEILQQSLLNTHNIKIKSILVRDFKADIIAGAYEKNSAPYKGCPVLIDQINSARRELTKDSRFVLCTQNNEPMSEVMVAVTVNDMTFFIHVIAYLRTELKTIGDEVGIPVTIQNSQHAFLYQSPDWQQTGRYKHPSKPVLSTIYGEDYVPAIVITTVYNQSPLMEQLKSDRFSILINTVISTLIVALLVLIFLRYFFKSLERVRNSLGEVVNDRFVPIKVNSLPSDLEDFVTAYNQIIMVLDDATDKHAVAEKKLRAEHDFIAKTMDSITNSVVVLDSSLIIKLINPAFEKLLNESRENLLGYRFTDIIFMYGNYKLSRIVEFEQLLQNRQQDNNLFYKVEDKVKEIELTVSPMLDMTSEDIGYVLVFKDVTEGRMLRRQLNYESSHDKLTGLLNRTAFEQKFEAIVNEVSLVQYQHVFVYINLDKFRVINQSCGNDAGDLLLGQVAEILQHHIRKSDLSACLGGDEYGLVLTYAELQHAANTVNDILANICKAGFSCNNVKYPVTASAALIPFGRLNDNFSEVLSQLTTGCALAKQNGGNQYYLIGDNDVKIAQHHASLAWVARINQAFVDKHFKLYAQPVVAVETETIKSKRQFYEILIRYQADDGEIIYPDEFLGAAEKFNLIEKIDRWVVSETMHWLASNPDLKGKIQFSINLSARSVCSSSFYSFLEQILQTDLVEAGSFCFEITEAAVVYDMQKTIEFINNITALGANFMLDNFGSGVSSLTYLEKIPVEYLKIDGVFIDHALTENNSSIFVSSIVAMGHSLRMKVIAEQVETVEMVRKLSLAKVDYLQGTAIQKPEKIEVIDFNQIASLPL